MAAVTGRARRHVAAPSVHPLCQHAENAACRYADVVVSMLPAVEPHLREHGLDAHRLHFVPNGISSTEWRCLEESLTTRSRDTSRRRMRAGASSSSMRERTGRQCARQPARRRGAAARSPSSSCSSATARRARALRRCETEVSPTSALRPVPKRQIPSLLAHADIAYIGWRLADLPLRHRPNKLMDYMMAGRAVLHSVDAGNDPVAEAGCGVAVQAGRRRRSRWACGNSPLVNEERRAMGTLAAGTSRPPRLPVSRNALSRPSREADSPTRNPTPSRRYARRPEAATIRTTACSTRQSGDRPRNDSARWSACCRRRGSRSFWRRWVSDWRSAAGRVPTCLDLLALGAAPDKLVGKRFDRRPTPPERAVSSRRKPGPARRRCHSRCPSARRRSTSSTNPPYSARLLDDTSIGGSGRGDVALGATRRRRALVRLHLRQSGQR